MAGDVTGIYLLTGDVIRFTSGPRKGDRFRRVSENFLRKLDKDGKDTNLRCVRAVLNNLEAGATLPADKAGAGRYTRPNFPKAGRYTRPATRR
jgi:hypothetical protein